MKKINIYALINPCNDNVFYVGATVHNIEDRLSQHIYDRFRADNSKTAAINDLINKAMRPEILLLDKVDYSDASFYEEFYINLFTSFGYRLHQKFYSTYTKMYEGKNIGEDKNATVVQAHLTREEYTAFKAIAEKKDWSDKKLTEKIVKLFLSEAKNKPTRINDL